LSTGLFDLLLHCGHVNEICIFGSFASGGWDEWSDIDLMVRCCRPELDTAVVAAVNAAFAIWACRPLEDKSPLSGRYWFRGFSPFHKLDVSFHGHDEWKRLVEEEQSKALPVTVLRAKEHLLSHTGAPFEWDFSDVQRELADILHRVSRYWRRYIRHGMDYDKLCVEVNATGVFLSSHTPLSPEERAWWSLAERTISAVNGGAQRPAD
jgi:predicted nucleotidyltransferase